MIHFVFVGHISAEDLDHSIVFSAHAAEESV